MRRFRELLVVHPTSLTTPAQDLHVQHVHLHDGLRSAARTAAATTRFCIAKEFLHHQNFCLREAHLHASRPHRGLQLTFGALERCVLHGCAPVFTGQGGWQTACGCGVVVWAYWWHISAKEKCSLTVLDTFVINIWETWVFCVCTKNFRSLSSWKMGAQTKELPWCFCFSVFIFLNTEQK